MDDDVAVERESAGATIMGRHMFSSGQGPWEDDPKARGWWGDDPPYHHPVFVLTHHEREAARDGGGTTFHFVTDGIEAALERARAAAGEKDVIVAGSGQVCTRYLKAGLVDELSLHVAPVFLGSGARLFEDDVSGARGLEVRPHPGVAGQRGARAPISCRWASSPPMPAQRRPFASAPPTRGDPFVIPNPWDTGSAKVMQALGQALATTSSGFAFLLGRQDGNVTLDEVAAHVSALAAATSVPLAVDLENGFRARPRGRRARDRHRRGRRRGGRLDRGLGPRRSHLRARPRRRAVAAAVAAARGSTSRSRSQHGPRTTFTTSTTSMTRSPGCVPSRRRAPTCFFAPGLRGGDDIRAVCEAVGKPVNVLAHRGLGMREATEAGAQRVSVGGALTWVAVEAMAAAAEQIRDGGDFGALRSGGRVERWLDATSAYSRSRGRADRERARL